MKTQANILDPIHPGLDERVWDRPHEDEPSLKPTHRHWIKRTVYRTLEKAGYENVEDWLSLVFTGSLTTYQYSEESDVDISLFVNATKFPDWSRAEMIGVMVGNVDGTKLPGTPFPLQCFVVPPDVSRDDLYVPGVRSGYDLDADTWIVPPDRERVRDVKAEMNNMYLAGLEAADKMEKLLRYEPDKAIQYWHQIHDRRRRDMKAGKGDYSQSNITYKMLANRGLFPQISEVSGEYIAKTATMDPQWRLDPIAVDKAAAHLGIQRPVNVTVVGGTHGQYRGVINGKHQIDTVWWLRPERANEQIWHELQHALQAENGMTFTERPEGYDEYAAQDHEVEARGVGQSAPFSVVLPTKVAGPYRMKDVRKFVFDANTGTLNVGELGPEEGVLPSHNQLAEQIGLDLVTGTYHLGTINERGYVQFEGGGGKTTARTQKACEDAILEALPNQIEGFIGGRTNLIDTNTGTGDWTFGAATSQAQSEVAA
jgi:hypothetical protein